MGSNPSTAISPDVGLRRVVSILSVVVLPAPFGPSNPNIDPRRTGKCQAVNRAHFWLPAALERLDEVTNDDRISHGYTWGRF